jgi:hypothetical protein
MTLRPFDAASAEQFRRKTRIGGNRRNRLSGIRLAAEAQITRVSVQRVRNSPDIDNPLVAFTDRNEFLKPGDYFSLVVRAFEEPPLAVDLDLIDAPWARRSESRPIAARKVDHLRV